MPVKSINNPLYKFKINLTGARTLQCGFDNYVSFAPAGMPMTKAMLVREYIANIIGEAYVFNDSFNNPPAYRTNGDGYIAAAIRLRNLLKMYKVRITHYGNEYTVHISEEHVDVSRVHSRKLSFTQHDRPKS